MIRKIAVGLLLNIYLVPLAMQVGKLSEKNILYLNKIKKGSNICDVKLTNLTSQDGRYVVLSYTYKQNVEWDYGYEDENHYILHMDNHYLFDTVDKKCISLYDFSTKDMIFNGRVTTKPLCNIDNQLIENNGEFLTYEESMGEFKKGSKCLCFLETSKKLECLLAEYDSQNQRLVVVYYRPDVKEYGLIPMNLNVPDNFIIHISKKIYKTFFPFISFDTGEESPQFVSIETKNDVVCIRYFYDKMPYELFYNWKDKQCVKYAKTWFKQVPKNNFSNVLIISQNH